MTKDNMAEQIDERVRIVGTSHISAESMEDIKKAFLDFKPDVICVELDRGRLEAMLYPERQRMSLSLVRKVGLRGFLFLLIGRFIQKKLGRMVGIQPGADMLFAVELARNNKLSLRVIDQPMDKTVRKLMKQFTFREFMRLISDIFKGIFFRSSQKKVKIDLRKVPPKKMIIHLMGELKKRYPSFYRILVDERNHFMARHIALHFKKTTHKQLVVVGAAHELDLKDLILEYERKIDVI